jgi:hypothetical protein
MAAPPTVCNFRDENIQAQEAFDDYLFHHYTPANLFQNMAFPDVLNINGTDFTFVNVLGEGSYGKVFKLEGPQINLAIKFGKSNDEDVISQALNDEFLECNCLRVRSVGKPIYNPIDNRIENNGYFMELAEGTLDQYLIKIKNIDPRMDTDIVYCTENIKRIIENIRKQMYCIYIVEPPHTNEYVYTDLKMANVLYKCRDTSDLNQTSFILGDLGSAVPDSGSYIATYPPYEHRFSGGIFALNTNDEKESAMAWELGVLLLACHHSNTAIFRQLQYNNIRYITVAEINYLKNQLEALYGPDIANLMNPNPALRRSILSPLV